MGGVGTWLILSIGFALASGGKPLVPARAALLLWLFLPAAVVRETLGVPLDDRSFVHPATLVVVSGLFVNVLAVPSSLRMAWRIRPRLHLAIVAALLVAVLVVIDTGRGQSIVLDQLIAPFCGYLLVGMAVALDGEARWKLVHAFVGGVFVVSLVAIADALTGVVSPFGHAMQSTYYWFGLEDRQTSTQDHPLVLAFVCALALPLVGNLRRLSHQAIVAVSLCATILLTESRVGALLMATTLAWLVVRRGGRLAGRVAGLIVIGLGYVAVTFYSLAQGVSERIADDQGSASARAIAWNNFFERMWGYFPVGDGVGSSQQLARALGMRSSFESAFIYYAVDLGIVFSVIYFVSQLLLVIRLRRGTDVGGVRGGVLSSLYGALFIHTFSSIGNESSVNTVLWCCLSLAVFCRQEREGSDEDAGRQEPDTWSRNGFRQPTKSVIANDAAS